MTRANEKLRWTIYRRRIERIHVPIADIARGARMKYPRVVGFFNGYWDLRADELSKVNRIIARKERKVNRNVQASTREAA